jgi:hypothetical protein
LLKGREGEKKVKENGKFKKKKVKFSQVSNVALHDSSLSLKAKGLYSIIQSYITLDNFVLYKRTLKKSCKGGEKIFEGAWKELRDKGYLIQEKHNSKEGFYYIYDLLDEPKTPDPLFAGVGNPDVGNGGCIINTYLNNTDINNTKKKKGDFKKSLYIGLQEYIDTLQEDNIDNSKTESIKYFINKRKRIFNLDTMLTTNVWENIYNNWFNVSDPYSEVTIDYELSILMIDNFFQTQFERKDCDYSILLYSNSSVKNIRYQECKNEV